MLRWSGWNRASEGVLLEAADRESKMCPQNSGHRVKAEPNIEEGL